ncbi:c-type cytochrome [Thalassomonas sp. M1454]|uniref:c-type cytochrome n=1 Tax=Thalassomonas sp. M1454 TaxID=2594477 RepID=UPI00118070C7|nr:cytochrome c [Thalassomonas sp. M1454]TRX55077.1 cytochrome c [Thalassomonas sp. M1454]
MAKKILVLSLLLVAFTSSSAEQEKAIEKSSDQTNPALEVAPVEQTELEDEDNAAALLAEQELIKAKQQRLKMQVEFCAPCHGKSGLSVIDIYPNLAGQHSDYLLKQLRDFKSKARKDNVMNGMVSRLTDEDMQGLAKYYAEVLIETQQPSVEIKDEKVSSTDL